jgi:hypothetical protein
MRGRSALALGALGLAFALSACAPAPPDAPKQDLHVLTSLPLFLGEGDIKSMLAGKTGPNALVVRLGEKHNIRPLDVADAQHLASVKQLLMIQPALIPPAELVALDNWVKAGGKAVILADPDLAWPHNYPLGDPRAPPASTLLDPLFKHWGLILEGQRATPQTSFGEIDAQRVALVNPGHWRLEGGTCKIQTHRLEANCVIGRGRVILIADADLVDPRLWQQTAQDNLPFIESLLGRLESRAP